MKNSLLLIFLLSSQLAFSQSEKQVNDAVQKLRIAMLAEDAETLKKLTSENLSYGHSSGVIETQDEFVAVFASKKSDYQKWDISDQTITFQGKKLAIVRHNVLGEIASNGNVNTLNLGLLMLWVKEKGEWKLLARQAFRVPQS
ncbi:nuclear transport factor 2 family protein [Algoriphagus sp.]|jgi:succinylglutamate desuccinylase|uniref:nuclear transport factor 2 family protein n=1 Tax=Algoriphagus sp. TaxID=1872435 RepID=UPI002720F070|nr:nuclear transport factor 2 family protein [Algoriphagus sp.]MDO8966845.1 nuclear transport factor 2 family protein [Algoriphagus sp.]MDP3199832.1 nuclear transport factor 2 family protein [Algoriphagus sp.]